jgi:hypothetical protein
MSSRLDAPTWPPTSPASAPPEIAAQAAGVHQRNETLIKETVMAKKSELNTIREVIDAAITMRRVYRESRCPCGCGGSWGATVSGTISDKPAIWMGCSRQGGSSVGAGLTGDAYYVACAVIDACERMGIDIDDVIESDAAWDHVVSGYVVTGPLAIAYEREILTKAVESFGRKELGSYPPAEILTKRRLAQRDIDIDDVCDGIWDLATN